MVKQKVRKQDQIKTPSLVEIQSALQKQGAQPPRSRPWGAQLQFILSNEYYAKAALAAINAGQVIEAFICDTGMGGYSLELLCSEDTVAAIRDKYNSECDRMKLY